jgi:ABC-type glycerol-3-phosphate transport system permease component
MSYGLSKKSILSKILFTAINLIMLVVILLPIVWMVSFSLKPEHEQFDIPTTFFSKNYTIENYKKALYPEFLRYILNSIIISISTVVIALSISIFSSYSFSRLKFPGRKKLLIIIILTQLFPLTSMIIPIYQVLKTLNLINTYPGFILAYLTFTIPVSVWMLRGFFNNIPPEIEEAAIVDGCSRMSAFFRVVLPVSKPGITATAIWIMIVTWQEFMFALVISTTREMRTLPVGLFDFFGQFTISYGTLMAGAVVVSIPIMIVFIFLQRYFIAGLTAGAVKG